MPYNAQASRHQNSLSVGQWFEKFASQQLASEKNLSINIFTDWENQRHTGESVQGVEFKYDARSTGCCKFRNCTATGNVAIEIAEKVTPDQEEWYSSGIYRQDNTWMYVVGNTKKIWCFDKNRLKKLHKSGKFREFQGTPTIRSFALPVNVADDEAMIVIVPVDKNQNYLF